MSTSAPCTTLPWMTTISPVVVLPNQTEASVDEPLIDDQSHGFGLVRENFLKVSFMFGIVDIVLFALLLAATSVF